eukprot:TRINITY_DN11043_c0_g1_i1.p1 TRINITY_DN11043_c0_g1~~TRINITY_DN11043_c0_g1_i1.p1  ORF type:complete len:148 (-),score=42.44 TRINITY_DN11043_c0_g1_i1:18-461(-)
MLRKIPTFSFQNQPFQPSLNRYFAKQIEVENNNRKGSEMGKPKPDIKEKAQSGPEKKKPSTVPEKQIRSFHTSIWLRKTMGSEQKEEQKTFQLDFDAEVSENFMKQVDKSFEQNKDDKDEELKEIEKIEHVMGEAKRHHDDKNKWDR